MKKNIIMWLITSVSYVIFFTVAKLLQQFDTEIIGWSYVFMITAGYITATIHNNID